MRVRQRYKKGKKDLGLFKDAQMDNLSGLFGIRSTARIPNARIRGLYGVKRVV